MKLRLSVPHTREDLAIWDRIAERHDFQGIAYSAASITADRSDAELMYLWEVDRASIFPAWGDPIERVEDHLALFDHSGPFL